MCEIAEYMISYVYENKLIKEYLAWINLPKSIIYNLPELEDWNNDTILNFRIYLEDLENDIVDYIYETYGEENEIKNIKMGKIMKKFNLPICSFWLTFVESIKYDFTEGIYY